MRGQGSIDRAGGVRIESNWITPLDMGSPSGGRPIHGILRPVGISDRITSYVVGVKRGI